MRSLVISDDFPYWNKSCESDTSGKLMLIDRSKNAESDSTEKRKDNSHVHQLFFDDNIERDRAHIVDVRNKDTFEAIPFIESNGRYLHRVLPYQAITQITYFADAVQKMIAEEMSWD